MCSYGWALIEVFPYRGSCGEKNVLFPYRGSLVVKFVFPSRGILFSAASF